VAKITDVAVVAQLKRPRVAGREHRVVNAHGEQNDTPSQVFGALMDTPETRRYLTEAQAVGGLALAAWRSQPVQLQPRT
jgi:hypothetical protein